MRTVKYQVKSQNIWEILSTFSWGNSSPPSGGLLCYFRRSLVLPAETEICILYSMWQPSPDTNSEKHTVHETNDASASIREMRKSLSSKYYNGFKHRAFSMGCDKLYPQSFRPSGTSQNVSLGMLMS